MLSRLSALALIAAFGVSPALAQSCGGSFSNFVDGLKKEAVQRGHEAATVDRFFANARKEAAVLKADRAQGVFQLPFVDFSRRLISQNRINKGRAMGQKYAPIFAKIEKDYGVSRGVLLAFWAFETDYGTFQGDFNTANALMTLAHDCRRPKLFRPQIFAALELFEKGDFDPTRTTGAWAGEIGMVQMLPADILENGIDGDGDGRVSLKTSAPDALLSGGKMLSALGWRKGEPWLQEVTMPKDFDWSKTGLNHSASARDWQIMGVQARGGRLVDGLPSSIILPQGRKGPAFLAYPNFRVYFEWNQSFTYVLTAAYFANRLEGAQVYNSGTPDTGLSGAKMKSLQKKLAARGYDVGKVDGILGAKTRSAVQDIQTKMGLPADAWPTPSLLGKL